MDAKFQDILDGLADKRGRSRLEPYRQLIEELQRRGRSYRDVAKILREKCDLQVSASTIHDFVRIRSRWRNKSRRTPTHRTESSTPAATPQYEQTERSTRIDSEDIRRKVAALKFRKEVTEMSQKRFEFDASQPLRLMKLETKKPDE